LLGVFDFRVEPQQTAAIPILIYKFMWDKKNAMEYEIFLAGEEFTVYEICIPKIYILLNRNCI
jgi:hypothetical protein